MDTIMIGIAGGTGSGKSTFTNRLKAEFGENITVIYHDNYYRRQDGLPFDARVKVNYDHPDSLETDLLIKHIKDLKKGRTVESPVYDFSQHNRSERKLEIKPCRVMIVEGILVLSDERLRDLFDIKIFVEADADERILRRVRRDMKERGRDLDGIISQYLTTVKPMHYLYVEPSKISADIIINSGMNDVAYDLVCGKIRSLLSENAD
ncbi:MAG: uridine kinase [Clostridia bacterium]|nr:uridine kinase [Clostridia bacterium]